MKPIYFKKGDYVYLIDHHLELDEDIKTDTIYWIVNKQYTSMNFEADYKLKDIKTDNIVFMSHKVSHVMRKLDKQWVRKLKMKQINERIQSVR